MIGQDRDITIIFVEEVVNKWLWTILFWTYLGK
jgi:hypothetical protein